MVASIAEQTTSVAHAVAVADCTVTIRPQTRHSDTPRGLVVFSFDYRNDGTYITCLRHHDETACLCCTTKCDATQYLTLRAFKRAVRARCLNALDTVLEQGLTLSID